MKKASLISGGLACLFSFVLVSTPLFGLSTDTELDLADTSLFPPELFPGITEVSHRELILAGLTTLFPRRIVTELPELKLPDATSPVIRQLEPSGIYIRVVHLPSALAVIEENFSQPLLILDLRYLSADLDSSLELASLLTRQARFALVQTGNYSAVTASSNGSTIGIEGRRLRDPNQTVFTLSNHETRGPIEAVLARLKIDREIISVGTASSGQTAVFEPFPGTDSYYLISGEIRPAAADSLVETGFLPRVEITVSETDDRIGYDSLRAGVSLADLTQSRSSKPRFDEARLLRGASASPFRQEETNNGNGALDLPEDPILRGSLNIVKALEALGKIRN